MKNIRRGFTLIEILIVVAIIAILASVVLVGLGPTQQAGRDARRLSDLRETQNALELYFNKCGYYPGAAEPGSCGVFSADGSWSDLATALEGSSLGVNSIPVDPSSGHTYYYGTTSGGSDYVIAATLENVNNSVFNGYAIPQNVPSTMVGSASAAPFTSCASPTYCITL